MHYFYFNYMHTRLTFREVFQRVGEVQSLIPPQVSIPAMTATVNYYRSIVHTKSTEYASLQMLIMSPLNMKVHYKRHGLGHE